MSTAAATRYIDNLGIVFHTGKDKEAFERLLDGRIVRVELDEGNGTRWISERADEEVEGHAAGTSLTLFGTSDDEADVEGHFHPGTYAPRFDLNTRDIEAKAALQRAMKEDRIRSFDLQDNQGRVTRINLVRRASMAAAAAGAAVVSFALVNGEAAQQAVGSALKLRL